MCFRQGTGASRTAARPRTPPRLFPAFAIQGILLAAIAGFPPFGVFAGEFLVLVATLREYPWPTPLRLPGIAFAFAGLFRHSQPMVYGDSPESQTPIPADLWPAMLHLAVVPWFGLSIPGFLGHGFNQATQPISGS